MYELALDFFKKIAHHVPLKFASDEFCKEYDDNLKLIKELVDKATPKFVNCPKGFQGMRYTRYICPNCNKQVRNDEKYCHKCGQHIKFPKVKVKDNRCYLDWSEDEN